MFNVLVFIDWYLPGYRAGGPVSSCANMVRALKDEINFKIVTRNKDYCHDEQYALPANQWVTRPNGEQVMYLPDDRLAFGTIYRIIKNTPSNVVYINGMYSRYFSIYPLICSRLIKKRIIIASRGMLSASAIGVKQRKKSFFLSLARLTGLYRSIEFHATNPKEKQDILSQIGIDTRIHIASNISKQLAPEVDVAKKSGFLKMVNFARIAPEKNLLFLLRSLGMVNEQIELSIYGSIYDEQYWEQCHELIQKLPQNILIQYCGMAEPDQVEDIIQQHHVLILPTLGENFGHVVAEAFLAGRPVIVSDQTPWRNLKDAKAGFDLPLSESNFAGAISFFANTDERELSEWVKGARFKGEEIAGDLQPVRDHLRMFLRNSESQL